MDVWFPQTYCRSYLLYLRMHRTWNHGLLEWHIWRISLVVSIPTAGSEWRRRWRRRTRRNTKENISALDSGYCLINFIVSNKKRFLKLDVLRLMLSYKQLCRHFHSLPYHRFSKRRKSCVIWTYNCNRELVLNSFSSPLYVIISNSGLFLWQRWWQK